MTIIFKAITSRSTIFKCLIDAFKESISTINITIKKVDKQSEEFEDEVDEEQSDTKKEKKDTEEKKGKRGRKKKDVEPKQEKTNMSKSKGSITIKAINTNESVFVHSKLFGSRFDKFICKKPYINIGVNLTNLISALKSLEKDDLLILTIDDEKPNYLGIKFLNEKTKRNIEIELKLIDAEEQKLAMQLEYTKITSMLASDLSSLFRGMINIGGDYVDIKYANKQFIFESIGDGGTFRARKDINKLKKTDVEMSDNEEEDLSETKNDEIIQGIFELKHLTSFSKCTGMCKHVHIYIENDKPLILEYKVGDLGFVRFCVSPSSQGGNIKDDDLSDIDDEIDEKETAINLEDK